MINQIRINRILQIAAPIIRQQDINSLLPRIFTPSNASRATFVFAIDHVVNCVDNRVLTFEELVRFHLLQSLADTFLAEGAADLF